MHFPKIVSAVASATFLATLVLAGDQCYYLDGSPAAGVYRCNNATSGDSSCCNVGQICYSNGVCQVGPEDHATDWLRVGCTDPTWSSPACLKQCTTLVRDSSAGIRPCGGIFTSDEYCCDTQGLGPGSLACCKNSGDVFAIKPIPSIIATIPLDAFVSLSPSTGAGSGSSTTHGLIPLSSNTASETLTSTALSASTTTTAKAAAPLSASSDLSFSSHYSTSGGHPSTAGTDTSSAPAAGTDSTQPASPTSSASATASQSTGPATTTTTTSSLGSRVGSGAGAYVSFAIALVLAGVAFAL